MCAVVSALWVVAVSMRADRLEKGANSYFRGHVGLLGVSIGDGEHGEIAGGTVQGDGFNDDAERALSL